MRPTLNPTEKEFVRPESERLLGKIDISATTHQQRVKIGDRLAEIGDPRPGVGLREDGLPDISWCEVPAGEITLEDGVGTFTVDPFYIGKYPVTWIQYRSFLNAKDGYQNKRWWKGLADRRQYEPGVQFRKLENHPAENVNWYDAVAFCRWLTKQMGYEIRLPTEWEWQQAATGGDPNNKYPWGAEWDSDRTNTYGSTLSRTTAVGLYPKGMSPVGALDISGNVLEWCLNEQEKPDRIDVTGDVDRAVRGGSWYDSPEFAHCSFRSYYFGADSRSDFIGFRLFCWSPIF
jgi:formylglycine-generating enzyme required for sulfatase activity